MSLFVLIDAGGPYELALRFNFRSPNRFNFTAARNLSSDHLLISISHLV